jgi:hypothetical protein
MNEEQARGLFTLAGINVLNVYERPNQYWPDAYVEERLRSPWWLVKTSRGMVEVGWRKNVISIDWTDTGIKAVLTEDEVTKNETMVHAYSYAKAVEYLTILARALHTPISQDNAIREAYDAYVLSTWDKQGDWLQWLACVAWVRSTNEKDQS